MSSVNTMKPVISERRLKPHKLPTSNWICHLIKEFDEIASSRTEGACKLEKTHG